MGYWKGSGISIALDLIATVLSNGNSVQKIGTFGDEVGLTQIMIAIDPTKGNSVELTDEIVNNIVADVKSSIPVKRRRRSLLPRRTGTVKHQAEQRRRHPGNRRESGKKY